MAYSERIKNFDRIRDYMRQFYVYGFKSRNEYDKKSARSYDNERRRIESWLGAGHFHRSEEAEGVCIPGASEKREAWSGIGLQPLELSSWADTLAFFTEADPLGVVGSFLQDKLEIVPDYFQFKHHYILHTLDSQLVLQLLTAIGEHRRIRLTNASARRNTGKVVHTVYPLKIFVSTQGGRQYLLCYHFRFRKLMFFRTDYIQDAELLDAEPNHAIYAQHYERASPHLCGSSVGTGRQVNHLDPSLSAQSSDQRSGNSPFFGNIPC